MPLFPNPNPKYIYFSKIAKESEVGMATFRQYHPQNHNTTFPLPPENSNKGLAIRKDKNKHNLRIRNTLN